LIGETLHATVTRELKGSAKEIDGWRFFINMTEARKKTGFGHEEEADGGKNGRSTSQLEPVVGKRGTNQHLISPNTSVARSTCHHVDARRVYQCEMASDVRRCGTRRRCDNSSEVPRSKNGTEDELLRPIRPHKHCGEGLALSQHSTFYIPKKYISSSI